MLIQEARTANLLLQNQAVTGSVRMLHSFCGLETKIRYYFMQTSGPLPRNLYLTFLSLI